MMTLLSLDELDFEHIWDNEMSWTSSNESESFVVDHELELMTKPKRKRMYRPLSDEAKERRNARRRKPVDLVPRLPSNDFRRMLPTMMINAFNSNDIFLMEKFVTQFFRGDCRMVDYSRQMELFCDYSFLSILSGVQDIVKYMHFFNDWSPDGVMMLHSAELRSRPDSTTIIARISVVGSLLFQIKGSPADASLTQLLKQGNTIVHTHDGLRADGPQAEELDAVIRQRMLDSELSIPGMVPMRDPLEMRCEGFAIMQLDKNGMIISLDSVDAVGCPEDYFLPLLGKGDRPPAIRDGDLSGEAQVDSATPSALYFYN